MTKCHAAFMRFIPMSLPVASDFFTTTSTNKTSHHEIKYCLLRLRLPAAGCASENVNTKKNPSRPTHGRSQSDKDTLKKRAGQSAERHN